MKKITVQQWLDLMPLVADRQWFLEKNNNIRDYEGNCPMCALAKEVDPSFEGYLNAFAASECLSDGLPADQIIGKIVIASDGKVGKTRQQLIEILKPIVVENQGTQALLPGVQGYYKKVYNDIWASSSFEDLAAEHAKYEQPNEPIFGKNFIELKKLFKKVLNVFKFKRSGRN